MKLVMLGLVDKLFALTQQKGLSTSSLCHSFTNISCKSHVAWWPQHSLEQIPFGLKDGPDKSDDLLYQPIQNLHDIKANIKEPN